MKLCRFQTVNEPLAVGCLNDDGSITDLTGAGLSNLAELLECESPESRLSSFNLSTLPRHSATSVRLLPPVDRQEIWAAGVTYQRSKKARMEESDFSATAYDRVYDAPRPEIFFKSLPEKVAGPGDPVGIRKDASWNVPEPELALVINSVGRIVGFTIGNDMSSRDIEGENLLYLPQAKVYDRSCAIGPVILVGTTESEIRECVISMTIHRDEACVFQGETSLNHIKRPFEELAGYLCRSQSFPTGAILLTGTGVVPGDHFTLHAGDLIRIDVTGIGRLENHVIVV